MGSKRLADIEEKDLEKNDEECSLRCNKRIKRDPLTPPREFYENKNNSSCSPYFEVEDYMVRGYESIQDVQCSLYDLTPEEEVDRMCCYGDASEIPRFDCDIDMM